MQINFANYPLLQDGLAIIKKLEEAGYAAYFVGGAVRDVLLGRSIQDVDIATSALPEQTLRLFPKSFATGLQHGTITVVYQHVNYEVTTFRVESDYVDFRRPEQVSFVSELKLDLGRRDFTMNAMAINIHGEVVDYYDGQRALSEKKLIAVGDANERFEEDALRMLRAVRFAISYQLSCDDKLWTALIEKRHLLVHIAMERINQELEKLNKHSKVISDYKLLVESKLLHYTKRPLHLKHVLEQWMVNRSHLLYTDLQQTQWFWAIVYAYSSLTDDEIREDLSALVFSKKMSTTIRHHISWIRFLTEVNEVYQDKDKHVSFVNKFTAYSSLYDTITKNSFEQLSTSEQIITILRYVWLEQLQLYPQAYLSELKPLLELILNAEFIHVLESIEHEQTVKKMTQISLTGQQCMTLLQLPAGPWIKDVLHIMYLAINVSVVENKTEALTQFLCRLKNDGVIG